MEDDLIDSIGTCRFAGIDLAKDLIPDVHDHPCPHFHQE